MTGETFAVTGKTFILNEVESSSTDGAFRCFSLTFDAILLQLARKAKIRVQIEVMAHWTYGAVIESVARSIWLACHILIEVITVKAG